MTQEIKVPDIGDFKNVPVIEVLVKVGDTVKPEDPLIALESDKATMEVPSPAAGVVAEILVKVGDKVGEGTVILKLEAAEDSGCRSCRVRPCPRSRACGRQGRSPRRSAGARRRSRRLSAPPSAPPISAPRWCWSNAGRCSAASASMSAASPPRRCCMRRRSSTRPQDFGEHGIAFAKPKIDLAKLRGLEGKRGQAPDRRPRGHGQAAQGHGRHRQGRLRLGQYA